MDLESKIQRLTTHVPDIRLLHSRSCHHTTKRHGQSPGIRHPSSVIGYTVTITISLLSFTLTLASAGQKGSHDTNHLGGDLDLYKITWHGPIKASQIDEITKQISDKEAIVNIATKDKERYMCIDPGTSKSQLNFDASAKNSSSDEKVKSPIKLLEPLLKGDYCSYKFELFWTYELCHGKHLRQYHEEIAKQKTKVTQEYYLGRTDTGQYKLHEESYEQEVQERERSGQSRPTILVNGIYKPYVMFNMTGGTKCDLTKKNRVARIVYVCNEEQSLELYSIKEISTCEYEAIVLSPHLCRHKDFKVDTATQREIKCFALDNSPIRPKKTLDFEDENDEDRPDRIGGHRRKSIAYLQAFERKKVHSKKRLKRLPSVT